MLILLRLSTCLERTGSGPPSRAPKVGSSFDGFLPGGPFVPRLVGVEGSSGGGNQGVSHIPLSVRLLRPVGSDPAATGWQLRSGSGRPARSNQASRGIGTTIAASGGPLAKQLLRLPCSGHDPSRSNDRMASPRSISARCAKWDLSMRRRIGRGSPSEQPAQRTRGQTSAKAATFPPPATWRGILRNPAVGFEEAFKSASALAYHRNSLYTDCRVTRVARRSDRSARRKDRGAHGPRPSPWTFLNASSDRPLDVSLLVERLMLIPLAASRYLALVVTRVVRLYVRGACLVVLLTACRPVSCDRSRELSTQSARVTAAPLHVVTTAALITFRRPSATDSDARRSPV